MNSSGGVIARYRLAIDMRLNIIRATLGVTQQRYRKSHKVSSFMFLHCGCVLA